jgi:hypothetical protein
LHDLKLTTKLTHDDGECVFAFFGLRRYSLSEQQTFSEHTGLLVALVALGVKKPESLIICSHLFLSFV